jgi:hypothetical protein
MAKSDDIPKTDPSEIEALVQRLKQGCFARGSGASFDNAKWVRD